MQKGSWVWWTPVNGDRPSWMLRTQKQCAAVVDKIDEKTGMVSIIGFTPARREWAKVVPVAQVTARGA
jgi:hypothetical protein